MISQTNCEGVFGGDELDETLELHRRATIGTFGTKKF